LLGGLFKDAISFFLVASNERNVREWENNKLITKKKKTTDSM